MAVWAIAWAGSKPIASLTDGLLARWVGIKWTGVVLALPAMLPIVALLALSVLVFTVQNRDQVKDESPSQQVPERNWLSCQRERLTSQEWFQHTAEKMVATSASTESVAKAPINA